MTLGAAQHVGSSWTRDWTHVSCIGRWVLCHWATWKVCYLLFFFLMWTFFKAFLKFVTISLLFYVFVFGCEGMWDLSFLTRAQTHARCIGWGSLNHWTTREDPLFHLLSFLFNLEFPNSFPNSYHPLRVPNKLVIPWILQIFISQTVIRSHICINSFLIQKAAFGCC